MAGWRWRDAGVGSAAGGLDRPQDASTYCVVDTDAEVDRVHTRAVAAGARSVREPRDEDYGGRACVLADFEGNHWSVGSYQADMPASRESAAS